MGTKLTSIIIILFVLTYGCTSKHKIVYESEEAFIQAYKISVFYGCMNKATNENFQKLILENNDLGTAPQVAVIFHAEVEQAIKVGEEFSEGIKEINYSDYKGKKPIFSDCSYYAFFSKEVDSIAKANYRKNKKIKLDYIYE